MRGYNYYLINKTQIELQKIFKKCSKRSYIWYIWPFWKIFFLDQKVRVPTQKTLYRPQLFFLIITPQFISNRNHQSMGSYRNKKKSLGQFLCLLGVFLFSYLGGIFWIKWGASSRWLLFLYCPLRNSNEMTIRKTHLTLWKLSSLTC